MMPIVVVTPKGAHRLRRQNPWCYRTEITEAPRHAEPGQVVKVVDAQHNPIGKAFYATKSPLALRLLTRGTEDIDDAFFRRRLESALARRKMYQGRDAMRLVHGEADNLPGLFVDRYGNGLVLQTLSEGADVRKEKFAQWLLELTQAQLVVCRNDASGRDFEGLPRETRRLRGEGPSTCVYHEGKNVFEVDLMGDMKTGAFLDQVDNHLRAGEWAFGEGLDCFSYHGGFALAMASSCTSVLAIEQDAQAAAKAQRHVEMNGHHHVTVQQANAFDVLRQFDKEGRKFDTLVLDPPGLAKRKEGVGTALRAYHELNLRAFKLLRPNGILITCSCSGKVSMVDFEKMTFSAAEDAKRVVQLLERRGAGADHPVLASLPETEYLKALVFRAL